MSQCIFCGKFIPFSLSLSFLFSFKKLKEPLLCNTCLGAFEPIDYNSACPGCSRSQSSQEHCADCLRWAEKHPQLLLTHQSLFTYNERAKDYMKQFKFQGDLVLARLFAEEIKESLEMYQKTHHIVPIPVSEESMRDRGFNQVELILENAEIHYENWLVHIGNGQRQSMKNRKERLESEQFFALNLELTTLNTINKPIIIIDDVYTTGRTILHAKNAFYSALNERELLTMEEGKSEPIKINSFSVFR